MIPNLFIRLFIRKAKFSHIENILKKENFEYTREDVDKLLKGNQKGVRYGNAVLTRNENGQQVKRFFKVMLDGTWKTFKPFQRQVEISAALDADEKYTSPTVNVIKKNLRPPVPYAIFETRENGDGFGFMDDKPVSYESFTDSQMDNLVTTIYNFHLSGRDIDKKIWQYTENISDKINFYEKELKKLLYTVIIHKNTNGEIIKNKVEDILEQYLGIKNISQKIIKIFNDNFKHIQHLPDTYLVHADMQIDNLYKHPNDTIELLDFEWVGKTNSPSIAIMYDYGNLRARAWSSPNFQAMLDSKMLEIGKQNYNEDVVKTGLRLGLLRYSLMMSRFHLDFKNTVKKDKRTEEDYFAMFPKTVESLRIALQ
ncbi:MAG: hypothetical protein QG589_7 [Patescibacteria group bacterium]|nr:hypothetical protein [Patescibacteria group bacterium]